MNKLMKLPLKVWKKVIIAFFLTFTVLAVYLIFHVKKYANKFCYEQIANTPQTSVGFILRAGINKISYMLLNMIKQLNKHCFLKKGIHLGRHNY
jgi:hypothetical protein